MGLSGQVAAFNATSTAATVFTGAKAVRCSIALIILLAQTTDETNFLAVVNGIAASKNAIAKIFYDFGYVRFLAN